MPILQTDFATGAKAAAEQQLLPTQVEERLKQLPMETQKLQLQLQQGTQNLQKGEMEMQESEIKLKEGAIRLQQMVTGVEQDKDTREAATRYFADPLNIVKPMHQQMQELGQIVAGKGNLKMAEKMFDDSGKALERQERAGKLQDEHADKQLEKLRFWVGSMTPENADTVVMDMMQNKNVDPKLAAMIKAGADRTKGDPKAFQAFKDMLDKEVGSLEGKKQRQTVARDDQRHRETLAKETRLAAAAVLSNERFVASVARSEQIAIDRAAVTAFNDNKKLADNYRSQLRDLDVMERARAKAAKEAPPEPSKGNFGADTIAAFAGIKPSSKWEEWEATQVQTKADIAEDRLEKARLKKLLKDAETGMTTARTLASKQYQSLLINSPEQPFAVPKNKDPKAKDPRTSGGAVKQGEEGSATNPKTVTSQAEAEGLPSGTHFIMNGRKGRIE
jgi:hypothetical protein